MQKKPGPCVSRQMAWPTEDISSSHTSTRETYTQHIAPIECQWFHISSPSAWWVWQGPFASSSPQRGPAPARRPPVESPPAEPPCVAPTGRDAGAGSQIGPGGATHTTWAGWSACICVYLCACAGGGACACACACGCLCVCVATTDFTKCPPWIHVPGGGAGKRC